MSDRFKVAFLGMLVCTCGWMAFGLCRIIQTSGGLPGFLKIAPAIVSAVLFIIASYISVRGIFLKESNKPAAIFAAVVSVGSFVAALLCT